MESHSQIEDEAAQWLARRDGGNWSQDDEVRLQQWIGASTARRVAYLRLKSTWDAAARMRALRAGSQSGASGGGVPPPGEWTRSPFFQTSGTARNPVQAAALERGTWSGDVESPHAPDSGTVTPPSAPRRWHKSSWLEIAAGVAFLFVAGLGAYQLWDDGGARYATAVGGFASVPMTDGSKVTLNTNSVIRVALTEKVRRVQLEQGEAFFDVAKDAGRPFIVRAGSKRITAVGTKFSVQHLGEDVRVLVTEGQVRVEDDRFPAVLVAAGNVARAGGAALVVQEAPPPQVEEILSWRQGYLRFRETALADAVAEMNRYNTRKIFIEDPNLAAIRISGTFRPTEYEAFVRVLQDGFAIQSRRDGERITLTQGP